MFQKMGKITV